MHPKITSMFPNLESEYNKLHWPKNMLFIKNSQFLPNHYETWPKFDTFELHTGSLILIWLFYAIHIVRLV